MDRLPVLRACCSRHELRVPSLGADSRQLGEGLRAHDWVVHPSGVLVCRGVVFKVLTHPGGAVRGDSKVLAGLREGHTSRGGAAPSSAVALCRQTQLPGCACTACQAASSWAAGRQADGKAGSRRLTRVKSRQRDSGPRARNRFARVRIAGCSACWQARGCRWAPEGPHKHPGQRFQLSQSQQRQKQQRQRQRQGTGAGGFSVVAQGLTLTASCSSNFFSRPLITPCSGQGMQQVRYAVCLACSRQLGWEAPMCKRADSGWF